MSQLKNKKNFYVFSYLFFWVLLNLQTVKAFSEVSIPSADDVTLIRSSAAVYNLKEKPAVQTIKTNDGLSARIEIDDAVVESDRILVRFIIWDLPVDWQNRVTDASRIYGKFLPVAELGTPSGKWLTPSTNSHYSLLSNGISLIVAGMTEFISSEKPSVVSFNFNQIPFDYAPLSESVMLVLQMSENQIQRQSLPELSDYKNGVKFSIMNTAQSPKTTMIQPAVSLDRTDETLSRFGWINISDTDGEKYAIMRENPYGFNLSDDTHYILKNAYSFASLHQSKTLLVSMDYVYVYRRTKGSIKIDLNKADQTPAMDLPLGNYSGRVKKCEIYETRSENETIKVLRLYIDTDSSVSRINFSTEDTGSAQASETSCGLISGTNQFACDIDLTAGLSNEITLLYNSFEYRISGPWSITWQSAAIPSFPETGSTKTSMPSYSIQDMSVSDLTTRTEPEILDEVGKLLNISKTLNSQKGWVFQQMTIKSADQSYGTAAPLVDHAQKDQQLSNIVYETWDHILDDGTVGDNISTARNDSGNIITATWNVDNYQIVLPQGLKTASQDTISYKYPFIYGNDFLNVLDTSASFISRGECDLNNKKVWCYQFDQKLLNGLDSENAPAQKYQFWIDPELGTILKEEIDCKLNAGSQEFSQCVLKDNERLDFKQNLDSDLNSLVESIIL